MIPSWTYSEMKLPFPDLMSTKQFEVWIEDAETKESLEEYQVGPPIFDGTEGHRTCFIKSRADQAFRVRIKLEEPDKSNGYGIDIYVDGKLVVRPVLGMIGEDYYSDVAIKHIDVPGEWIVPLRFGETKTHPGIGTKDPNLLRQLGMIVVQIYPIVVAGPTYDAWPNDVHNMIYNSQLIDPLRNHSAKYTNSFPLALTKMDKSFAEWIWGQLCVCKDFPSRCGIV